MTNDNYALIKRYANSEEIKTIFRGIVGDKHAEGYIYSVIIAVSASPALQKCTPISIMHSAARAASLGLSCDPALGQAYLVPYSKEATLIPGWRGIRDMAYKTGQIQIINVGFLGEGQEWVINQLTGEAHIEGLPESTEAIGYFAYMKTLSGREHSLYMSNEEVIAHKVKYAKGYEREKSTWKTEFSKMAKKTVLRNMLNQWATLDPMGVEIANLDYATDSIDNMPDPEGITIIDQYEGVTPDEHLDALGYPPDPKIEKAIKKVGPAEIKSKSKPEQLDTSAPATIGELKTWAVDGNLPGVSYKEVDKIYKTTGDNLADTWMIIKNKTQTGQEALI